MSDQHPTGEPERPRIKRGLVRAHPRWCIGVYLVLLLASNLIDWRADEARLAWGNRYMDAKGAIEIEVDTTGLPVRVNPLAYRVIVEGDPDSPLPPVLLIHGSPGSAGGFDALARALSRDGRRVIYMDLPGFASQNEPWSRGRVFEDYGADTYAAILWRLLEAMGDEQRVHVLGWSNGGAVALRMIEQQPDRVASLTMLAAVGAQENEGTGSYAFEHFKYKLGRLVLDHGSHLYPHFGLLGAMGERHAFLRYFDDTDQRDLGALMESIDTPTMIMHGRHDFLIPARAAEDHYRRMRSARLVMMDAMHFIPFLHPDEAGSYLRPFFAHHDAPGRAPETGAIDLAPVPVRSGADLWLHRIGDALREHLPWWVGLILFVALIRVRPYAGVALVTLLVAMLDVDFAVAMIAILLGRWWWLMRGADPLDRPWTILGWIRSVLFFLPAFVIGIVGAILTLRWTSDWGLLGLIAGIAGTTLVLRVARLLVTREGWARMSAGFVRVRRHEYYPSWVHYLPVLWIALVRIIRGRGVRELTSVNPGYSDDGGIREERKSELDARFPNDPSVLRSALVEPSADLQGRFRAASALIENRPELGGYPIIAKPDQGARGEGVRVVQDRAALRCYIADHPEPFVLQRYHPGPVEVGIVWVRDPETIASPRTPAGRIYALNTKELPRVVGDGKRSLRQLILGHQRHRAQASMFLARLGEQQHLIPDAGESIAIGTCGNHAQGAMFCDGSDLITPELSAKIDAVADGFRDPQGRGFDIGRFDIRCDSESALKRGEGLGIVELNGLTSEPANMYDPHRSLWWSWGVLVGYWRRAEDLAEARIRDGSGEAISTQQLWSLLGAFVRVMLR